MKKYYALFLLVLAVTFMAGCKKEDNQPHELTIAYFDSSAALSRQIDAFTAIHPEYTVNLVKYDHSDIAEEDGVEKIKRELIAGEGPDIIDFGYMYNVCNIAGDYTIDLAEYIEKSGNNILPNVISAFSYNGRLPVIPTAFSLYTLTANTDYLKGKDTWNAQEIIDCYMDFYAQTGGILYCGQFKQDVLMHLLLGSVNSFIDWETGKCYFDQTNFKNVIRFANMFSSEFDFPEDAVFTEYYRSGKAMLYPGSINGLSYISSPKYLFPDGKAQFIGYPTDRGSASVISSAGDVLAITAKCSCPEVAFDYINLFLTKDYQYEICHDYLIPVNSDAVDAILSDYQHIKYDPQNQPIAIARIGLESDVFEIYSLSQEECDTACDIIRSSTFCGNCDSTVRMIIQEEVQPDFEGVKSVDDVCDVVQSRISIYVNGGIQ